MNYLLESGYISELQCGSNFSYILSDNKAFLSTEYKVLQSQAGSGFVKCMRMLYNGKIQLYYSTKSLKPFANLLPSLDADRFLTIVSNLLSSVVEVKQNGFLSCQNIDISFDKIFVDPSTHKVSLVYLPISKRIFMDSFAFENEIRTGLVKLITGVSTLSSAKTMQLAVDLSNGMLSLEELCGRIKSGNHGGGTLSGGNSVSGGSGSLIGDEPQSPKTVRLTAMNAPTRVELTVNKDPYVIGKSAAAADGVIGFSKMISRVHCRIEKHGTQYQIIDLQSSNGTYVNRTRLQPNQPQVFQHGDVVRLANIDFQVSIT